MVAQPSREQCQNRVGSMGAPAVVHARLGQRLKLKGPVLIRGGDAGVAEPASHRAKSPCRMPAFSHGLFAHQASSKTLVQAAVQKLLSFWTVPSLVALPLCLPVQGRTGWSLIRELWSLAECGDQ